MRFSGTTLPLWLVICLPLAAEPTFRLETTLESQNGPPIHSQIRLNSQTLEVMGESPVPLQAQVKDEVAQKVFDLFRELTLSKVPALLSGLPQSERLFEVDITVPSLEQRFRFRLDARLENP